MFEKENIVVYVFTSDGHGPVARYVQTCDGHGVRFSGQRRRVFVDRLRASHFSEIPISDLPVPCRKFVSS